LLTRQGLEVNNVRRTTQVRAQRASLDGVPSVHDHVRDDTTEDVVVLWRPGSGSWPHELLLKDVLATAVDVCCFRRNTPALEAVGDCTDNFVVMCCRPAAF